MNIKSNVDGVKLKFLVLGRNKIPSAASLYSTIDSAEHPEVRGMVTKTGAKLNITSQEGKMESQSHASDMRQSILLENMLHVSVDIGFVRVRNPTAGHADQTRTLTWTRQRLANSQTSIEGVTDTNIDTRSSLTVMMIMYACT